MKKQKSKFQAIDEEELVKLINKTIEKSKEKLNQVNVGDIQVASSELPLDKVKSCALNIIGDKAVGSYLKEYQKMKFLSSSSYG